MAPGTFFQRLFLGDISFSLSFWAFAAGAFVIIFPIAESYIGIFIFFQRIVGKKSVGRKLYSDETIEHVTSIVPTKANPEAAKAKNNHTHDTKMDKGTYVTKVRIYHESSSIDINS